MILDDGQLARLERYLDLLAAWSRRARLTAVADPAEAARVHVADSLLCLRADIPFQSAVVDVGSGAGLPGIPLLIARPDLRVTLVEPSRRKAAFLEMVCAELDLPAEVIAEPSEAVGRDATRRETFDVAVARAVAPLPVLAELLLPLVRPGGKAVLLKGPAAGEEVERSRKALEVLGGGEPTLLDVSIPGGPRRVVVTVPKARPTPDTYPRRPGVPRRRPLA
ncbi:MAG: 16S rRNA (guanine(527)-N(7))-methyltransferase RsmG [Armatimonadota bacterium]|nr:16S rRNA (guanine(527)-N(7))-methyltransferase RsmG [Armatimonadota bacterium]MDR7403268.1 16S rRNA (guanine(527)-N(7))-methyltransferase RsmG [Armatimonadota bacterium]